MVNQLEPVIGTLVDRSEDAVGAVQHGVEALGVKLGLLQPPRRRRSPWVWVVGLVVAVGVVAWFLTHRTGPLEASADQQQGSAGSR